MYMLIEYRMGFDCVCTVKNHYHTQFLLQSFWDMVYFQVEDVQNKFDTIGMLEKNGWKNKVPTPAKKRTKVWKLHNIQM